MASPPESKEEFLFISSPDSPLHPLHKHEFKVDDMRFMCIQQYVLRQKMEIYKARKLLSDLMNLTEPAKLKKFEEKLGIVVNPTVWQEEQKEATKRAYLEKGLQYKPLHNLLCDTKGKVLVYADSKDSNLGIGLMSNDPNSRRRSNWKGKNLLGEWLREVQEEIPQFEERTGSSDRETTKCSDKEKFTFFWRKDSPFSQWHACNFTVDGQQYNCAEQYMMHQKAVYFSDSLTAEKILKTRNPKEQKALGREVKKFDADKWDIASKEIVKKGNLAKFGQNEDLKKRLFETKGTTLVEASPADQIWGIGLTEEDPRANDRKKWRGENRLGEILTAVREELMCAGVSPEKENLAQKNADHKSKPKTSSDDHNTGQKTGNAVESFKPPKRHGGEEDGGPPKHKSKSDRSQTSTGIDGQQKGHPKGHPTGIGTAESKGRSADFVPTARETKMEAAETPSERDDDETGRGSDAAWNGFEGMDLDVEVNQKHEKKERERKSRWSDIGERIENDPRERSGENSRRNKKFEPNRIEFDSSDSEKFTFFWRADSPFSQHHPASFHLDGCRYNCAEQYMMHMKAVVFEDEDIAYEIMSTNNPAKQKSLAKQVSGFDDNYWKTLRRDVVKRANLAKFSQNPRLRRMLLATAGTTMVEASPVDNTWGIGLNADDPKAWRRSTWAGTNLLGEILTEVREELMIEFQNSSNSDEDVGGSKNFQHEGSGESYTVFWRPVSPFHPRYPVGFVVDKVHYWTLLQYIVHQKALFSNDSITAREVMETIRPNKLEELGRKVRNYDHRAWSRYCRSYLVRGNFAKFSQNPNVRQQLIDNVLNGETVYSVEDRLLGVGMNEEDPRINRKKSWKGKNLLGQALMEVREMLVKNEKDLPEIRENEEDEADEDETSADNIFFFFIKSPFNQWHRSFFEVNDTRFNCAEQYMLHACALHFNDPAVASDILSCRHPSEMQNMYPKNYDDQEWSNCCREIIKIGNYAKFSQDRKLHDELLRTEDAIIAFSAEKDTTLGIGLRDSDPRALDRRNWPGQNLLGEVLMEVRSELKEKMGSRRQNSVSTNSSVSQDSIASSSSKSNASDEKFTFFWQRSPFSQWWSCDINVNGCHYNCTEQYMMHQKALFFNDANAAAEIMRCNRPRGQYELGRKIKNYNSNSWNTVCVEIVKQGNLAKFQQHRNLRKELFATAGTTLVEASPIDRKWGIGVKENDSRAKHRERWLGRNLLGEILTEIREEMMMNESYTSHQHSHSDIPGSGSDRDQRHSSSRDCTTNSHKDSRSGQSGASFQGHGKSSSERGGHSRQTPDSSSLRESEYSSSDGGFLKGKPEHASYFKETQLRSENWFNESTESKANGTRAENPKILSAENVKTTAKGLTPNSNLKREMSDQAETIGKNLVESGSSGKLLGQEVASNEPQGHKIKSSICKEILYIADKIPLNPWYKCSFKVNNVEYNSVGQYLNHQKALLFKDEESAKDILGSTNPVRIMKFAKHIKECEADKWKSVCRNVLKNGNYHKFSQNEGLNQELLDSSGKFLVYVDNDTTLGIGLKPNDKNVNNQDNWKGENLLGYVLMDLCEDFIQGRASECSIQDQNSTGGVEVLNNESKAVVSSNTDLNPSPSVGTETKQRSEIQSTLPLPSTNAVEKVRSDEGEELAAGGLEEKYAEAGINVTGKDEADTTNAKKEQCPLDDRVDQSVVTMAKEQKDTINTEAKQETLESEKTETTAEQTTADSSEPVKCGSMDEQATANSSENKQTTVVGEEKDETVSDGTKKITAECITTATTTTSDQSTERKQTTERKDKKRQTTAETADEVQTVSLGTEEELTTATNGQANAVTKTEEDRTTVSTDSDQTSEVKSTDEKETVVDKNSEQTTDANETTQSTGSNNNLEQSIDASGGVECTSANSSAKAEHITGTQAAELAQAKHETSDKDDMRAADTIGAQACTVNTDDQPCCVDAKQPSTATESAHPTSDNIETEFVSGNGSDMKHHPTNVCKDTVRPSEDSDAAPQQQQFAVAAGEPAAASSDETTFSIPKNSESPTHTANLEEPKAETVMPFENISESCEDDLTCLPDKEIKKVSIFSLKDEQFPNETSSETDLVKAKPVETHREA